MPTILIADDAGLFMALETSPLLRSACTIVAVRSPADLLARASTDAPDLFLLDADQFGHATRGCIRSIKADRRLAGVPIVLAARETAGFLGLLGAKDRIFSKPVPPDEIGSALKSILPIARRASRRVPVSVPVLCFVDERESVKARSKDLATGGIFLKTTWGPARGTRFEARFSLPRAGRGPRGDSEISALCEVVRLVGPQEADRIAGVGAVILEMSDTDAGRLRDFVSSAS